MTSIDKNFGVGCFGFQWKEDLGDKSGKEWIEDVIKSLQDLPNIYELECDSSAEFLTISSPEEDSNTSATFHPNPHWAWIEFKIKIPKIHQARMFNENAGEDFKVTVLYKYYGPVAFVQCLGDSVDDDAATSAVGVVREHLTKAISDSSQIKFVCTGPSPFHMDFHAVLTDEVQDAAGPVAVQIMPQLGYDQFKIKIPLDEINHADMELSELFMSISDELSLYYCIIRSELDLSRKEASVFDLSQEVIKNYQKTGFGGYFSRLFSTGSKTRDLTLAIMDVEVQSAWKHLWIEEQLSEMYNGSSTFFEAYLRKEAKSAISPLVSNAKSVIFQLEPGRSREVQLLIGASMTLMGGVAGGLVSLLAN